MSEFVAPLSRFDRLLERIVEAGLLAVILVAPTQRAVEVLPKMYVCLVDPLAWLVFGVWVVATLRARRWAALRPPLMPSVLLAAAAVSALRAGEPLRSAKDIVQMLEYFVAVYLPLADYLARPERRRRAAWGFLAAGSVVVGVAAAQYLAPDVDAFQIGGTFGNRNVLGGYLALLLPFAAGVVVCDGAWWRRAWAAGVMAAGLAVVLSGGALIAAAAGIAVVAACRGRAALALAAAVAAVFALAVLPHLPHRNADVLHASVAAFNDDGVMTTRYPEWQAGLNLARDNALTGVGPGNYQRRIGGYYGTIPDPAVASEPDSQCLYLVLAASLGMPGLLAFLAWLAGGIAAGLRGGAGSAGGRGTDAGLAWGAAGALLGFAVCAVWAPLLVRGIGVPLVFMLALAAAAERDATSAP